MLAYGVTAARDPQPAFATDVFAYRERERAGELLSPRVFSTGMAYLGTDPPIETLDDARDAVRPNAEYYGSESFKTYYDPFTARRAWQLLATAGSAAGLNVTVHGQGVETHVVALLDGFEGLEHAPQVRIYDDVVTLIARSGTIRAPTYGVGLYGGWHYMLRRYGDPWAAARMRRFAPPAARAFTCEWCTSDPWFGPPALEKIVSLVSAEARIVAKGGRVGMGSHGDIPGLGPHYEMWFYANRWDVAP